MTTEEKCERCRGTGRINTIQESDCPDCSREAQLEAVAEIVEDRDNWERSAGMEIDKVCKLEIELMEIRSRLANLKQGAKDEDKEV